MLLFDLDRAARDDIVALRGLVLLEYSDARLIYVNMFSYGEQFRLYLLWILHEESKLATQIQVTGAHTLNLMFPHSFKHTKRIFCWFIG